jgi:hypothetical protein
MYSTGFAFTHSHFAPANDTQDNVAENIHILVATYCRDDVAPAIRDEAVTEIRALRRQFN